MFTAAPEATFDPAGAVCCPKCRTQFKSEIAFGQKVKCQGCREKFQLQKRNDFLRLQHLARSESLARSADSKSRDSWIALTGEGRLNGVRNQDLQTCMRQVGLSDIEIVDYIESSNAIVKAGARAAGRAMFFIGIFAIAVCVALIALLAYLESRFVIAPIGFAGIGLVYILVGLVKWLTGWNIH